jgi:hypothetical protein
MAGRGSTCFPLPFASAAAVFKRAAVGLSALDSAGRASVPSAAGCNWSRSLRAFLLLWRLGGHTFGGGRGGYCLFLIFEMICQISLTPRPSMAENGTGSPSGICCRIVANPAFNWLLLFNLSTLVTITW